MTRVLVTGSDGFVGKHLVKHLSVQPDLQVYAATRKDYTNNFKNVGVVDTIVNLASASGVEASVKDPAGLIKDNVNSTLKLLEFARKQEVGLFIQFSTVEVYNITNPYAASKSAQEKIVEAYVKTFGLAAVILRSNNIVGEGQSVEKFVPKVVDQIRNHQVVLLYKGGAKSSSRYYIPVENAVDAVAYVIQEYEALDYGKILEFDLDGGEALTNYEMAKWIAQLLGKKLHYEYVEPSTTRPTYATNLLATGKKLTSVGWQPPVSLGKGMSWIR